MAWVSDTFDVVVGSEGDSSLVAPLLHLAHGVTIPVLGWGELRVTLAFFQRYQSPRRCCYPASTRRSGGRCDWDGERTAA